MNYLGILCLLCSPRNKQAFLIHLLCHLQWDVSVPSQWFYCRYVTSHLCSTNLMLVRWLTFLFHNIFFFTRHIQKHSIKKDLGTPCGKALFHALLWASFVLLCCSISVPKISWNSQYITQSAKPSYFFFLFIKTLMYNYYTHNIGLSYHLSYPQKKALSGLLQLQG